MIVKNKLVAKYYFQIVIILSIFLILGFFSYVALINIAPKRMIPPLFMAKIVDAIDKNNKIVAIQKLLDAHTADFKVPLELFDQNGKMVYPEKSSEKRISSDIYSSLTKPYDYKLLNQSKNWLNPFIVHWGNPPYKTEVFLIRLDGNPTFYLKIFPPPRHEKDNAFLFFLGFILLFIALLLGVAVSMVLIYASIVKHTKMADQVISELQKGNLKARFPINRTDELGSAMERFNKMAEEIEGLVVRLQQDEKARINLLQELAHDLKTPITSLKMLLETLDNSGKSLTLKMKEELISLSRKEVDYFARLIDDLLLLAQVSEPKYQVQEAFLNLSEMLNEEIYDSEFRESQKNIKKIVKKFPDEAKYVYGDLHLLRRLFRNALNNALSFSSNVVIIDILSIDKDNLKIIIQDDGPGFSEDSLKSFGERSSSRKLDHKDQPRISFGLGSVIMKAICHLHGWGLHAGNLLNDELQIVGGRLEIVIFGTKRSNLS